MTFNRREQMIGAVLGGIVVLIILGNFLILPYFSSRADLAAQIAKAQERQVHDTDLLANEPKVNADWKRLTADALMSTESDAVNMLNAKFADWAARSDFSYQDIGHEKAIQKGDFKTIKFTITGPPPKKTCDMDQLARMLGAIEGSGMPLQVDELSVGSKKDHDDLNVTLKVNALIFSPAPPKRSAARPAAGEEQ